MRGAALLIVGILAGGPAQSKPAASRPGADPTFPKTWIDGSDPKEPPFQAHEAASGFHILRQSIRTNFEGPFLYLILGGERALLVDSGAGGADVVAAIRPILDRWGEEHHKKPFPLIVAHSHGHGDHVAGDAELAKLEGATVVGRSSSEVKAFFHLPQWPEGRAELDLGGRILDVFPIPGHQEASIAIYDRATRCLLTGDTLYPGRLYVEDFPTYRASVARLAAFAKDHPISWILGAHIEMTSTPGKDYPGRAKEHPAEHPLQLAPASLSLLSVEVEAMKDDPKKKALDDFVIFPLPRRQR
jgi:glyoxylase-like metal-dependent hydrolase (beta-lactamase superfamily II)